MVVGPLWSVWETTSLMLSSFLSQSSSKREFDAFKLFVWVIEAAHKEGKLIIERWHNISWILKQRSLKAKHIYLQQICQGKAFHSLGEGGRQGRAYILLITTLAQRVHFVPRQTIFDSELLITPQDFLSPCLWATLKGSSVQYVSAAVEKLLIFLEEEQSRMLLESSTIQWEIRSLLKLSLAAGTLKPAWKILQLLMYLQTKHHVQGAFWSMVPAAAMTIVLVLQAV